MPIRTVHGSQRPCASVNDIMLINPRVSLLFLVVGSFMGLWSQDQQPSVETVIAEARAINKASMIASYEADSRTVAQPDATPKAIRTVVPVSTTEVSSLDVDPTIPAGFYRAVSHKGDSKLIRVLRKPENLESEQRDFYTIEVDSKRWYLIRVNSTAIAGIEERISHQ